MSVIIPAYKAARTIARAVESVLAQTRPAHEVIVIDDGSPDDITAALAPFGSAVTLLRQPNGGAASARNRGIEHATGDFIAFLDADDYWEREKLAKQIALFERYPELGMVAGAYHLQQPGAGERTCMGVNGRFANRVLDAASGTAFLIATMTWTGTVVVRRNTLAKQRFVSGLEPAEDRDLWVRLIVAGPIYLLDEPLATAVLESGSLSRTNLQRDCTNFLRVIERQQGLMGARHARMWRAHTYSRWAANEPRPAAGLLRLMHSIACWPLPLRSEMCSVRFIRAKLFVVSCLRLMGLRRDARRST